MLARTHSLAAQQLLEDLLAVKDILRQGWVKGDFKSGNTVCTVGAVNTVVGLSVSTWTKVLVNQVEDPKHQRAGALILSLHSAIYGPEAPTNITVSHAAAMIGSFNDDSRVTHDVVLLAVDRAIQELMG